MDQRKVNMLAREYCADIKRKNKPIILSHRMSLRIFFFPVSSSSLAVVNGFADMLPGLQQGQEKMSKSDPSSAIFMEDEEVNE